MNMIIIIVAAFSFLFCVKELEAQISSSSQVPQLSADVQKLFDDYWNWKLQDRPQFATFVGIHEYDDDLDDLSEEAYQNRSEKVLQFLDRASILETSLQQEHDIVNVQIMINELNTFKDGFAYKGYYYPVSYFEGPQTDYKNLFGWMPKRTLDDYNKIILRLEKIPQQIDQMIQLMRRGVQEGKTFHDTSMKTVQESLLTFVTFEPSESPLYQSIFAEEQSSQNLARTDMQDLQLRAQQIISVSITPAYKRMLDFVTNEYVTRSQIAITSITEGNALYQQLIKFHTNTDYSAQEIHNTGLNQVQIIEGHMLEVIQELGYDNISVPEFSARIRADPDNYYRTSDELMARFNQVSDQILPRLNTLFNYIPKATLQIVPNPSPTAPGAFYYVGSYDGSRPGTFKVNTYDLTFQPKYTIMTLSLHEGNPGHHLQGSHNIESENIPFFRRASDDRNYNLAPSIFPLNTAFVEGWGLYAETLGFDLGLYDDLLERYGHYSYAIFRACRLVVDTGIHALGWSKERAVQFMLEHTADSESSIRNEIDRYVTWPGQALGYKIGEMKIQDLKVRAQEQLQDLFDIKDFHDVVLDSAGPLEVVESQVENWIERTLGHRRSSQEEVELQGHQDQVETPLHVPQNTGSSKSNNINLTVFITGAILILGFSIAFK